MNRYQIHLSNRDVIMIDEDDYEKLKVGMGSGTFVILKDGGVINPSFISHIRPIETPYALPKPQDEPKIEGYLDAERKVFVVTKDIRVKPKEIT